MVCLQATAEQENYYIHSEFDPWAQPQAAYPPQSYPTVEGYPPPGAYAAPPPAGYPGAEYAGGQEQPQAPGATTNRSGQGLWEGW
ncbi:hypothetical protein C5167_041228 [Papaver somniferum]|uniref:Cysteine-rich transmembrane CYSTM domain-containing protein n=1 Tax=Papaver somniferum TaxID=3469 RepID=A0A4Y7ILC5_PAPSO|nr:hypothetical protein C5167_041228 [Papaver somniferum]